MPGRSPVDTRDIVAEYLQDCQARGLSPATLRSYTWALNRLVEHSLKLPTTGKQLRPLFAGLDLARETRRNFHSYLSYFYRWTVREYGLANPMLQVGKMPSLRTLPRVLTDDEVYILWGACRDQLDLALVAVPLDTGIRLGEIANLRWSDVGPDHITVSGKRGQRRIPLSPSVKRLLLGLGDGHHLWTGVKGPLTRGGLQLRYRRLYDLAGLTERKNGAHTLRHTFATHYIAKGGNLFALKEILGHTSVKTTEIYLHLSQAYTKTDHSVYSPIQLLELDTPTSHQADG